MSHENRQTLLLLLFQCDVAIQHQLGFCYILILLPTPSEAMVSELEARLVAATATNTFKHNLTQQQNPVLTPTPHLRYCRRR